MRNCAIDQYGYAAALGACVGNVAVIDCSGRIIAVNSDWVRFARQHGALRAKVGVGANYLEVCRAGKAAGDPDSAAALEGIAQVLAGGSPEYRLEYRCGTDAQAKWFEMIVHPLRRPEGGAIITHLSIESRRAAELQARALAQDLARIQRLTVFGNLATTFVHELAQPLTAINANTQALREILAQEKLQNASIKETLADITADNVRAARLIQQLHSMLKKGSGGLRLLRVNSIIRNVTAIVRGTAQVRKIKVVLQLEPGLPLIWGDRLQLQQVILNLMMNAFEAMHRTRVGHREVVISSGRLVQARVLISVQDFGSGIPPEQRGRIFQPFYTTKSKGLGMGLAICRSIVEAHHGEISVDNNRGRGVTFRVILPSTTKPDV